MSHAVAIFSIFTGLATVAVALRLFTRLRVVRTAGWDDGLIVIALITDYVFFAFAILEAHHGLGTPRSSLPQNQITQQLKALYFTIPFYNLTLSFTKISMLVLYLRLLPMMTRYRLAVTVSLCIIPIIALWMVLSSFMFCIPVSDFWSPMSRTRCLPRAVWFVNAALQIVTDLWIVALPMPVLARLKLPKRQKVAVVLVFGLGIFVCIMSIVRLAALAELVSHNDDTYYNSPAAIWSSIEANVAIMCSSLPSLRPLIVRLLPSSLRTSTVSEQERRVVIPSFVGNGDSAQPDGQHRETSLEPSLEMSREESQQGQGQKEGGVGSVTPDGIDSGIQVIRELRLDADRRRSKGD